MVYVTDFQTIFLVHGDVLLDYTEKSFDNLPSWIQENVDDNLSFDYPFSYPRRDAFMEYDLKFWYKILPKILVQNITLCLYLFYLNKLQECYSRWNKEHSFIGKARDFWIIIRGQFNDRFNSHCRLKIVRGL